MRLYIWKYSLIVAALVALTFACALVQAGDTIAPSELADRINTDNAPLILDVRTPGEYATGHIPGAVNIPHTELRDRLSELMSHQNEEIVVHCQTGPRAGVAQSILSQAGFMQIRELEGHMQQWKASGYPIE
jgi:rhodanese-related sulfurtransferase